MVDDVKKCSVCAKTSGDLQKYFHFKNVCSSCRGKSHQMLYRYKKIMKLLDLHDHNWDIILGSAPTKDNRYINLYGNMKQVALKIKSEEETSKKPKIKFVEQIPVSVEIPVTNSNLQRKYVCPSCGDFYDDLFDDGYGRKVCKFCIKLSIVKKQ